jgi:hypothetical protein
LHHPQPACTAHLMEHKTAMGTKNRTIIRVSAQWKPARWQEGEVNTLYLT